MLFKSISPKQNIIIRRSLYSIALVSIILIISIFTGMTAAKPCSVTDGEEYYDFSLISPSEEKIIEKAVSLGMPSVNALDVVTNDDNQLNIKRAITLNVNDGFETVSLTAYKNDVLKDVLAENNFDVDNLDLVTPALLTTLSANTDVSVKYYTPVTVFSDGVKYTTTVYSGTVEDALCKLGIDVENGDIVSPDLDENLDENSTITILRENNIEFSYMGTTNTYETTALTVEEFLGEISVELGENDILNHEAQDLLEDEMLITLDKVEFKEYTETEVIKYKTNSKADSSMETGERKTVTAGVNGEKETTYSDKYVNGEVVETTIVSEKVTKEAVNEEIRYGTKTSSDNGSSDKTFTDFNGNKISYSKKMVGECTAYCEDGITSTGQTAQVGIVAVDPKIIPYGTKLYITSNSVTYGYAIAGDTGGALLSGRVLVDLYYDTAKECFNFGRRDMTVYILD